MSLVEEALSKVLAPVTEALEETEGEFFRPKKKRKVDDDESTASKVWRKQLADERAAAARSRAKVRKRAVIVYGRFNPPTTGHARLFEHLVHEAEQRAALPVIFTSAKCDEHNPLPFQEKVAWLKRLFPSLATTICNDEQVRTPIGALTTLQGLGFDAVTVVVGSDQVGEFSGIAAWVKKNGVRQSYQRKALRNVDVSVVPIPRRDNIESVAGMSGTKMRKAVRAGNYLAFRRGVPTKVEAVARKLYFTVRKHMGLTKGHAFLLCGFTLQGAQSLREAFGRLVPRVTKFDRAANRLMEQGKPFYVDVSGQSSSTVRGLVRMMHESNITPTIYLRTSPMPKTLTEAYIRQQSTFGDLKSLRNAVVVESAARAYHHAKALMEAEGETKQPSEVDRIKVRQKAELLATRQRQGNDLLNAKTRELQKKSREDAQKIANSQKPGAHGAR